MRLTTEYEHVGWFLCDPIPSFRFSFFDLKKKIGLLMHSDRAKSDGTKSDLSIRWPKSPDFRSKSDDSAHLILKSKNGIRPQSSKNLIDRSLVQQQDTEVRVAIDAFD